MDLGMDSRKEKRDAYRQLGAFMSAGMVFPVSIAIGYAIGHYLDGWLGTTYLTIIFLVFGIVAGFVSFFRTISKVMKF